MVFLIMTSHLLARHPKARVALLGKPGQASLAAGGVASAGDDPFVQAEDDPEQCGAMQSTLWEIATLQRHYYAPLAAIAVAFRTELPGTLALQVRPRSRLFFLSLSLSLFFTLLLHSSSSLIFPGMSSITDQVQH